MDGNSFINSLVHHFTDSDTEAQGDSNDLGARLLALSLQAAPGQAGHLRQLSGRARGRGNHQLWGHTRHPSPSSQSGQHLPARNSTFISSKSRLQGPMLPSALWATRCQAGPCSLHGKSTAGSSVLQFVLERPRYQGSPESRRLGKRCMSSFWMCS